MCSWLKMIGDIRRRKGEKEEEEEEEVEGEE